MSEIMAIAGGTWKGILRMKVVYFLILCVWVLIASALNYDVISWNHERALMVDVALLLNQIAAMLVVLSVTFEVPKELKEGVASTLLTKSLGRMQYILGKMIGIVITGFVICGIIAIGSVLIFKFSFEEPLPFSFVQNQILLILSIIPMASIGVFFAVVVPEALAPILTLIGIWFSYSTYNIKIPVLNGGILPNLDLFNFKSYAVYNVLIPWKYVAAVTVWGIAFAVFALMLTSIIFRFKDIK